MIAIQYLGNLFVMMMERVGLIVLLAVLLVQTSYFRELLTGGEGERDRRKMINIVLLFGFFAVLSNLTGIIIHPDGLEWTQVLTKIDSDASIANTRSLVIGVSGIIGGPTVGTLVGLIAGLHRVYQANGGGLFYIISSPLIGLIAGNLGRNEPGKRKTVPPETGSMIAVLLELVQLMFIAFFSADGWELVKIIAIPMTILNSVGTYIFLWIIQSTLDQEEHARAIQTHEVLELTSETLPYLREGLDVEQATAVAELIKEHTKASAVSLTNQKEVLAHVGAGSDHHKPTNDVITALSKDVIENGHMQVAHSRAEIGCTHPDCPLAAAIVVPLVIDDDITGTLKFYFSEASELSYVTEELAEGLASIFSMQIELGRAELQTNLLQEVEIKALQAQINPHFFFNMINVILAIMRTDPDRARVLLLDLTVYFRQNIQATRETKIKVSSELEHVMAYLNLNEARFPDRYHVHLDMDESLNGALVPPLCIQVLIENAINHAFVQRKGDNQIHIELDVIKKEGADCLSIVVWDNGVGIDPDKIDKLGKEQVQSKTGTGTALDNLARRINLLYGSRGSFEAANHKSGGAQFTLKFPLEFGESNDKALKGGERK